jgi:sortase A
MRVVFLKHPLRQFLLWIQWILLAAAVATLGYCLFIVTDTWRFQQRERLQLERVLANHPRHSTPVAETPSATPLAGGLVGRIDISRLGVSAMVMEGTTKSTLRRAVGHIAGTALPGKPGNVGLSGHRDTFFRPLRNIRQGDIITLTTAIAEYRYRVVSTKVVGPRDVSVLDADGAEILSLVTCYPFYFVGSAPDRFIVRAERVRKEL